MNEQNQEDRNKSGDNFIIGRNSVLTALENGEAINRILIADGIKKDDKVRRILDLLRGKGIRFSFAPRQKLDEITEKAVHQGVVAFTSAVKYYAVEDLLDEARRRNEAPFIVVLDSLEDPHNLGAIVRTAAAAGVHGIVIPANRSVLVTPTVAKVAAGTLSLVKIVRVHNLVQAIKELKASGLWFYAVSQKAEKSYAETDFSGPVALVLGSEGKGIRRLVEENCDFFVRIPMRAGVESLNVSVSAGILIFKVFNDRGKS